MNKVTLIGNIVADPKATLISNGNERSSFTVATKDTKNFQETYFIPCVAWKPLSTFINTNIKKGDLVAIDGRLVRRPYTPVDGKTIYVTEVVVDAFETLLRRSTTNVTNTTVMNPNNDSNIHNFENDTELNSTNHLDDNHSTNLDTVFSTSSYEQNNQDDSSNDDIDWDSEFN